MSLNENAQKWVDALRSGEFEQTTAYLHDEEGYCCLGVACELYAKEHPDFPIRKIRSKDSDDDGAYSYGEIEAVSYLPSEVMDWLGLKTCNGEFDELAEDEFGEYHSLDGLNDEGDYTFQQIADFIETEPEGLFIEGE